MLSFKIKFDDKNLYKIATKSKAMLEVGFWGDMYEAIDKPFYASVPKPNTVTANNPYGKPRRYGAKPAISVARVATVQEYGLPEKNIPPRPFMRDTVRKNWRKWRTFVQDRLPITLDGKKTLTELGDIMSDNISQMIIDYSYPPNRPSTIKIKGFNNPLVDSGQMSESVRMRVK